MCKYFNYLQKRALETGGKEKTPTRFIKTFDWKELNLIRTPCVSAIGHRVKCGVSLKELYFYLNIKAINTEVLCQICESGTSSSFEAVSQKVQPASS